MACLGGITAFQVSLAAGAPLGVLAYGGGHEGVLPTSLRVTSAVASLVWGGALVAVATGRPHEARWQRVLYSGVAGVAGLGAMVNLASPSLPERFLWVPVTAVLAVAAWHEARSLRPWRRSVRAGDDVDRLDDGDDVELDDLDQGEAIGFAGLRTTRPRSTSPLATAQ